MTYELMLQDARNDAYDKGMIKGYDKGRNE